jgi:hypothetical protein
VLLLFGTSTWLNVLQLLIPSLSTCFNRLQTKKSSYTFQRCFLYDTRTWAWYCILLGLIDWLELWTLAKREGEGGLRGYMQTTPSMAIETIIDRRGKFVIFSWFWNWLSDLCTLTGRENGKNLSEHKWC